MLDVRRNCRPASEATSSTPLSPDLVDAMERLDLGRTINRTPMRRLVARRLAHRIRDTHDRRPVAGDLTPSGKRAIEEIYARRSMLLLATVRIERGCSVIDPTP